MGVTKINTGIYEDGVEVYFCYIGNDCWFETKYSSIDVLSKDMINFAHNVIWSNQWN